MHVTNLMEERIPSLSRHIRNLHGMLSELEQLLKRARRPPDRHSGTFCHIIESASPPDRQKTRPAATRPLVHVGVGAPVPPTTR